MKKKSWFWVLQVAIWLGIGLINFSVQHFAGVIDQAVILLNFIGMSVGGFLVTSGYRLFLKARSFNFGRSAGKFITTLLGSALLQSVLWILFIMLISLPMAMAQKLNMLVLLYNIVPLLILTLVWDLFYLGYHLIRRYHETEVEKWKLEAEVQKAQLGTLKLQINPHFMFNALNNIRALILEDPKAAREMLTKFAVLLRHSLQNAEKLITVAQELDLIVQYLAILKLQYEERLNYTISCSDEVRKETIPPMILQLLVENAIKHGIAMHPGGGSIEITIVKDESGMLMRVKNTGTLKRNGTTEEGIGIGLNNITDRLALIYGDRAKLNIEEQTPFVIVDINIET